MPTNTVESQSRLTAECAMARSRYAAARARPGVLLMRGKETLDFLQRMSTNDMAQLAGPLSTILVSEKGKVIDVVTAVPYDGSLLLFTSESMASEVRGWLEKFIIVEDVEVLDVTDSYECFYVIGPESDIRVKSYLDRHSASGGAEPVAFRHPVSAIPWHTVASAGGGEFPENELISEESLESLRIEEGIPRLGKDIDAHANPLELGLEDLISFSKGCYIGQEVVARLHTYQKTARFFRGFLLGRQVDVPVTRGEIIVGDAVVGFTTSHAWSSLMDQEIALGYLRSNVNAMHVQLRPEGSAERMTSEVVHLPFRPHGA